MVTNIKLNDGKYIATFEICDNNEDYSICNLGQKLTNDVIQVNKTFIDIDIYKSQMEEKDQRIAELEQDLEFTTKTANELIEIKHKLEQELAEVKENAIVPKFKVGQECYYVYTKSQLRPFNVKIGRITFDTDRKNKIIYDSDFEDDDSYFEKYYGMKECNLFATEKEAQEKLKEIQGNE